MGDREYFDILNEVLQKRYYGYTSDDTRLYGEARVQIIKRDKNYSELLESYVNISKARNILKEIHKWALFWGMVVACIMGYRLLNKIISPILESEDIAVIVEAMPVLIAALVSFVSSIIAVPLAVVNFLFNKEEDENITEIIKHTQDHDAAGRIWIKPSKSAKEAKEQDKEN